MEIGETSLPVDEKPPQNNGKVQKKSLLSKVIDKSTKVEPKVKAEKADKT